MDFIAIDFELANSWNRSSACSVGIVEFRNNKIVNEYYSLINPKDDFDYFCIDIHGITPEMVENEPTFNDIWPELITFLDNNLVVAHNASFDMSVLRHCLNENALQFPTLNYVCSYLLSKRLYLGLPSYRLDYLIRHHGLEQFDHHHALSDAKAAGDLFNQCLTDSGFDSLEETIAHYDYQLGNLCSDNTYRPFRSSRKKKKVVVQNIVTTNTEFDTDHPFYDKSITFTGTLKSINRKAAMQKVVDIGGQCGNGVTLNTNYLVVGIQDLTKLKEGTKKSSKMIKAEKYANDGLDIEIIAEDDFLNML